MGRQSNLSISQGIQNLKNNLADDILVNCIRTANGALQEVKEKQKANMFWENQTYEALDSMGAEVEINDETVSMKVGFIEDNPSEERDGKIHVYDKYIATYSGRGSMFLGQALTALAVKFSELMPNIGIKSDRARYKGNNVWKRGDKTWSGKGDEWLL